MIMIMIILTAMTFVVDVVIAIAIAIIIIIIITIALVIILRKGCYVFSCKIAARPRASCSSAPGIFVHDGLRNDIVHIPGAS